MTGYMDEESLIRRTGYKQKAKQIAFLEGKGIPVEINSKGEPVVLWSDAEPGNDAPSTADPEWAVPQ